MTDRTPRFLAYRVLGGIAAVGLLVAATAMVPRPVAGTPRSVRVVTGAAAQPAVIAHVHVRAAGSNPTASVRFALREGAPWVKARSLTTPADVTVDLTTDVAGFVCDSGCTLRVDVTFDNAPAKAATATGALIILARGGYGVDYVFPSPADLIRSRNRR
jgi:hypothetical protein